MSDNVKLMYLLGFFSDEDTKLRNLNYDLAHTADIGFIFFLPV